MLISKINLKNKKYYIDTLISKKHFEKIIFITLSNKPLSQGLNVLQIRKFREGETQYFRGWRLNC
jgi:hypothetical protein